MSDPTTAAIAHVVAESGILQRDWAARVGVSRAAVSNWVRGENAPSERNVRAMVKAARSFRLPDALVDRLVSVLPPDPLAGSAPAGSVAPGTAGTDANDPELGPAWEALGKALRSIPAEERADLLRTLTEQVEARALGCSVAALLPDLLAAFAELGGEGREDAVRRALVADVEELVERARLAAAGGRVRKYIHRDASYVLSLFTQITLDLPDGHHYHTVSNMDFWSSYTLASRRDFLATQERAVREGRLDVKRLFLLRRGGLVDEEVERLEEHAHASPIPARVLLVRDEEVEGIGNFVLCGPGMGREPLEDTAIYQLGFRKPPGSDARELSEVGISSDARLIAEKRASFEAHFAQGVALREFLDGLVGSGPVTPG